MVTLQDHLDY